MTLLEASALIAELKRKMEAQVAVVADEKARYAELLDAKVTLTPST